MPTNIGRKIGKSECQSSVLQLVFASANIRLKAELGRAWCCEKSYLKHLFNTPVDMRASWPALFVITALIGLGFLQYQWLKEGVVLEKQRLDREVRRAMARSPKLIEKDRALWFGILSLQRFRKRSIAAPDSLRESVRLALREKLNAALQAEGLALDFKLQLTEGFMAYPLLEEPGFDRELAISYRTYTRRLQGALEEACECQLLMHLQLGDFLPLLLQRLSRLLIPALFFFLLLLLGFGLLLNNIRRERRLGRIKNDFINNLTHEMKTPVFSISLLSRLLRSALAEGQYEKGQDYLGRIEAENDQLKQQVEKVLELASLEHPRYQLGKEAVQLQAILERASAAVEPRLAAVGGGLRPVEAEPGLWVQADEKHLGNALQCLLDNALKYGGQPPEVQLRAYRKENWVCLEVEDNGPGVPAKERKRIFKKFYRGRAQKQPAAGFGLGLSYVQQVAQLHGGRVGLSEGSLGGAAFRLCLPALSPAIPEASIQPQKDKQYG